ncbi:MAG: DUF2165 family protein [Pararhodobacter sp.]
MTVALHDNLRHPEINEQFTREFLSLARIKCDYPGVLVQLEKRSINDPRIHRAVFLAIVIAEMVVVALLWFATAALVAAAAGMLSQTVGRALALVGAFGFVAIWAAFVTVGNHFIYWLCHEGAHATYFQLLLWGMATLLLIALA